MLQSCVTELALGPFGPQNSLNHRFCCYECSCLSVSSGSNGYKQRLTNLPQNGSKIGPEWLPKWLQNRSKIDPVASWRALGPVLAAWKPLGGHLEDSWKPPGPNKNALERLLNAPRRIPRQVSAILGPKSLPKWTPKRFQNEVQKRFELKIAKSQKPTTVHRICLIFEVPGHPGAPQTGSKAGSES